MNFLRTLSKNGITPQVELFFCIFSFLFSDNFTSLYYIYIGYYCSDELFTPYKCNSLFFLFSLFPTLGFVLSLFFINRNFEKLSLMSVYYNGQHISGSVKLMLSYVFKKMYQVVSKVVFIYSLFHHLR